MKRPIWIKIFEIIGLILIAGALIISIYDYTQNVIPCNPGGEKYNSVRDECSANGLAILFFGVPLLTIGLLLVIPLELIYQIKFKKLEQS